MVGPEHSIEQMELTTWNTMDRTMCEERVSGDASDMHSCAKTTERNKIKKAEKYETQIGKVTHSAVSQSTMPAHKLARFG